MSKNVYLNPDAFKDNSIPASKINGNLGGTSKTTMLSEPILVQGGPLADDISENWPTGWYDNGVKQIPSGITIQEMFQQLFLKTQEGTVEFGSPTWSPAATPSVAISSQNGTVEVGSKVKITTLSKGSFNNAKRQVALTATYGYFDEDGGFHKNSNGSNKYYFYSSASTASTASGKELLVCKWNGFAVVNPAVNTELTVVNGTNTIIATQSGLIATVSKIPTTTVYASTNINTKLESTDPSKKQVATFEENDEQFTKDLNNTASASVTGSYYYFVCNVQGTTDKGLTINSDLINAIKGSINNDQGAYYSGIKKSGFVNSINASGTEIMSSVVVPKGGNTTIIAVPTGYKIKQILSLQKDVTSEWSKNGSPKEIVEVTLPDNSKINYNIFYKENGGGSDGEYTNLKIGK